MTSRHLRGYSSRLRRRGCGNDCGHRRRHRLRHRQWCRLRRTGLGVDDTDRFRSLTTLLQQTLLFLHSLTNSLLPLLLDLNLQTFRLAPALLQKRSPFLLQPLDFTVDRGLLPSEPIVLQASPLATIEHGEKSDRREAGHSRLGVFANHHPIDSAHVVDGRARGPENLDSLDSRPIDPDAGTAHVLERVGLIPYVNDLARLDPAPSRALKLFTTEAMVDDHAVLVNRASQILRNIKYSTDLPDGHDVSSEIGIGKIAILDEDPALQNRRLEAMWDARGVAFAVGRNRGPPRVSPALAPGHPRWGPGIPRNPKPAKLGIIIPAAIMIDRPREGL